MARYRGQPMTQLDGSAFAHSNCVLTVARKLADLWTLGFWQPPVRALRVATGDTSGGVTFEAAEAATARITGGEVALRHRYSAPTSTLDDLIDAGRELGVTIHTAVTAGTPFATGRFRGLHLIAVLDKRAVAYTDAAGAKRTQKQGLVMDPGHSAPTFRWWPWALIVKAAQAATAGAGVHVLYGRDRVNVARTVKNDGAIRSAPQLVDSPKSNVVGHVKAGQTVTVAGTVDGGPYPLGTRKNLTGWNQLGPSRFVVAKIR